MCFTNGDRERKQTRRNSPEAQTAQHTPICAVPLIMEVQLPQSVSSSSTGAVGNVMSKKRIPTNTTQTKKTHRNTRSPPISQNRGSAMHRNCSSRQTMDAVFVGLQQMHADFEKLMMQQADQHRQIMCLLSACVVVMIQRQSPPVYPSTVPTILGARSTSQNTSSPVTSGAPCVATCVPPQMGNENTLAVDLDSDKQEINRADQSTEYL
ncbi:hypothetical protein NDU88_002865 [Pleurodeles waltl]|uniref:Uncharacterized protein n=1 Tax=Pleurodeles waltl TaxID=8319 RepID=A0AAV7NF21_PLEWA|nr:hypothetical protein NDU88_002865 [Pleurodeles waltl]